MILKRIGAALLAVAMIAAAIVVRDQIDGDGSGDTDSPNAGLLVCATELVAFCRDVADRVGDGELVIVEQQAGETIDSLSTANAEPALWLTYAGFPQMLNEIRVATGLDPLSFTASEVASSPIGAVVRASRVDGVIEVCGDPVDLGCIGATTALRPAVSIADSGIGLLALTAAVEQRTGGVVDTEDVDLLGWARGFRRSTDFWNLGERSAVASIQTLTAMTVALGAEAELVPAQRDNFRVLYADPMVRARVVLVRPDGFDVPDGLAAALSAAMETGGWGGTADAAATAEPNPQTMLRVRSFWSEL